MFLAFRYVICMQMDVYETDALALTSGGGVGGCGGGAGGVVTYVFF